MKYLALVIGNCAYQFHGHELKNAANDAISMAAKLRTLSFDVIEHLDINRTDFGNAVAEFVEALKHYDAGLFYFAGHAFQTGGKNFLAPVDTDFTDEGRAKYFSYELSMILDDMQASGATMKIVILDACRNNPFGARGAHPGLATVFAPKGTLIAFSTSPGETARDGGGGNNSVYTGALLSHIDDEHIAVEELFKRVRTTVYSNTNGGQTPWEHTSLIGSFYFNSGQRIQSLQLPYKPSVIKDADYMFDGTPLDGIIADLKIRNWDTQNAAFRRIDRNALSNEEPSKQFLLGRNLLQVAEGGSFILQDIFTYSLAEWLAAFTTENKNNHILNGILYEVYFDSGGNFRGNRSFKTRYLDEIYRLQETGGFDGSFQFIREQLTAHRDSLCYIPSSPPVPVALDLVVEPETVQYPSNKLVEGFNLRAVRFEGRDVYLADEDQYFHERTSFSALKERIASGLAIPKHKLRLTNNGSALREKDVIFTDSDLNF